MASRQSPPNQKVYIVPGQDLFLKSPNSYYSLTPTPPLTVREGSRLRFPCPKTPSHWRLMWTCTSRSPHILGLLICVYKLVLSSVQSLSCVRLFATP